MARASLTLNQLLPMLADAPPRLATITAGATTAQLHTPNAEREWSVNEVLAHLRACADVWGDHLAAILAEEHPTRRAINPTTWIVQTDYPQQEFYTSLRAYTAQRAALMELITPLTSAQWQRTATLVGAGKPLERTAFHYAESIALHERPHLKHLARLFP